MLRARNNAAGGELWCVGACMEGGGVVIGVWDGCGCKRPRALITGGVETRGTKRRRRQGAVGRRMQHGSQAEYQPSGINASAKRHHNGQSWLMQG